MNAMVSYVSDFENAGKRIVNLDAALNSKPQRDQVFSLAAEMLVICGVLRHAVTAHEERLLTHDEVSDDLTEQWVEEARQWGENSRRIRKIIANAKQAVSKVEGHRQRPTGILILYRRLTEEMIDLADLMEDVAETQALAAHKPFRDHVAKALEDASAA